MLRIRNGTLATVLSSMVAAGCAPLPESDLEGSAADEMSLNEQRLDAGTAAMWLMKKAAEALVEKILEVGLNKAQEAIFGATDKETTVNVLPVLEKMKAELEASASDIAWSDIYIENEKLLSTALTAVEESRRLVAQGLPAGQGSAADFNSSVAWKRYSTPSLFLRSPDVFACPSPSWRCFSGITARPFEQFGLTYDWRMTGPVMLRVVAARLAVIALRAPNFLSIGAFADELAGMRDMVRDHRRRIADGIVCGHVNTGRPVGPKFPGVIAGGTRHIICADIHTNEQLSAFQASVSSTPQQGGSLVFDESATAATKARFRAELLVRTPVAEMDEVASALGVYADPYARPRMVVAHSNDVLWSADQAVDGLATTAYSSHHFPSSNNDRGAFIAAWTSPGEAAAVNQVHLTARTWHGAAQAFPKQYHVWITTPDNSAWMPIGWFSTQPDPTGMVRLNLGATHHTYGVYIVPQTLGTDGFGGHYFQLAEVQLVRALYQ